MGQFEEAEDVLDIPSTPEDFSAGADPSDEMDEMDYHKEPDYRPKVLITGAKGQLGVDLSEVLSRDFNIFATDIEEMDVTSPDDVISNFALFEPDIVIHAAAYTNVDGCETNQAEAFKINAIGTQNIALACQDFDTRMLYISTDYVFDGSSDRPYREYMHACPINKYGESKLMGEHIVQHLIKRHFIVRTSWLFGTHGHNFVKTMLRLSNEKNEIGVVDDQRGRPTYTRDLAQAISHLINSPFYGTYHVCNSGETTWCGFTKKIFELAKRDTKVKAITTDEYPTEARRPRYSVLDTFFWELRGYPRLRSWEDALVEFMKHPTVKEEFPFLK